MLDIAYIRDNLEEVKRGVAAKQLDTSIVDKLLEIDKKRRALIGKVEELRRKRNEVAKDRNRAEEGKQIKEKLKGIEPQLKEVEREFENALYNIPAMPASDVKVGKDDSENEVVRSWGEPRGFEKDGFKPKDHMELGTSLGIIDTDTSANVTGTRFNYLKGDAVLLQFALIQFALETLTSKEKVAEITKSIDNPSDTPFIPVVPPVMMKTSVMNKMGRLYPKEERYILEKDDLVLVGSAEHTLGPMHMDTVFSAKDLPKRYLGYSTAFRREAGTYGKDTSGILRVHQFDKLEMESFSAPENGESEHKLMTAIQEYFMQKLGIPYQVIMICTGDMGKPDYRQTDINCWMPGQNKYRETHTSDFMTDYQARRLNTKVQKGEKTEFVHMNDATAFAIGRTIIAIIENYQQKDGSVVVPEVLRKWMGKERISSSKDS